MLHELPSLVKGKVKLCVHTWRTWAYKVCHNVDAYAAVQTGIRFTLVDIQSTSSSSVAWRAAACPIETCASVTTSVADGWTLWVNKSCWWYTVDTVSTCPTTQTLLAAVDTFIMSLTGVQRRRAQVLCCCHDAWSCKHGSRLWFSCSCHGLSCCQVLCCSHGLSR